MFKKIRLLLEKTNNISKSTYIWNSMNAMLSAVQSTIILMTISRTNGVDDAGVFSLAYAFASLMLYVGQYGIRKYQASDVEEQFSFSLYMGNRVITCFVMIIASLLYCIYGLVVKDYAMDKFAVIILVCTLKVIQAFADVIHGRIQQLGRLDIAAKASFCRTILSIISCIITLVVTSNLVISMIVCVAVGIIGLVATSINVMTDYGGISISFEAIQMFKLFKTGFPLFISSFLSMYIGNAPKYAIDNFLSNEIQAYYGFIFMPAFIVQLLVNFIFNPILTEYARIWAAKNYELFDKLIKKQMLVITGIMLLGIIVAATIGIQVLSFVFAVNLNEYKLSLCIIMIGGGMLSYVSFFVTIMTITRHQTMVLYGYCVVALMAKFTSGFFVTNYEVLGAATMYTVLMILLAISLFVMMKIIIKKDMKINEEKGYYSHERE